jgi:hypothetical protein
MSETYGSAAGSRDFPTHPASLPYAGTSGWSGSEASRQRAEERDSSGKTAVLQDDVEAYVANRGIYGATIKDVRDAFPDHHHGSLSGALTVLHKGGRLMRLEEQRDKCSVYVLPVFLHGRRAVPPKGVKRVGTIEVESDWGLAMIGAVVFARLQIHDEVRVRMVGGD